MDSKTKFFWKVIGCVILFFVISWLKGCGCERDKTTIIIPVVKGYTTAVKPQSVPVTINKKGTAVLQNTIIKNLSAEQKKELQYKIDSLLQDNKRLQSEFSKSTNKDSLYNEAIKLQNFYKKWNNENLTAEVSGISRGTVESIKLDYTIKERKQEIKIPTTVFRLLGGIEIGTTKDLSKMNFKANVGLQNRSGGIISVSADTEQRFYVGYAVSIFSIKR